MKLKTISFAAMLLTLGVFVACSNDEEYVDNYSLIGRTKAAPTEDVIDPNTPDWFDNPNLYIPREENCCAYYALTERYIDIMGIDAFTRPVNPLNAEVFYDSLKTYVNAHQLDMNNDGSMPLSTMMELSQAFGTSEHAMYGEITTFDEDNTAHDYLNVSANRENVAALIMMGQDGKEHVVHVSSAHSNYMTFEGYNGATENYNGGDVYFNDHGNHQVNQQYYQITGILTKE